MGTYHNSLKSNLLKNKILCVFYMIMIEKRSYIYWCINSLRNETKEIIDFGYEKLKAELFIPLPVN